MVTLSSLYIGLTQDWNLLLWLVLAAGMLFWLRSSLFRLGYFCNHLKTRLFREAYPRQGTHFWVCQAVVCSWGYESNVPSTKKLVLPFQLHALLTPPNPQDGVFLLRHHLICLKHIHWFKLIFQFRSGQRSVEFEWEASWGRVPLPREGLRRRLEARRCIFRLGHSERDRRWGDYQHRLASHSRYKYLITIITEIF